MFNNETEGDTNFCESYKSQILNNDTEEKDSSFSTILKILTILLLLTVIVFLAIYGYNHVINSKNTEATVPMPPSSIQISDEDLKVMDEDEEEVPEVQENLEEEKRLPPVIEENTTSQKPITLSTSAPESDIEKITNSVKVAIAQQEERYQSKAITLETEEKSLEVPVVANTPQSKYLEDLADLSKEIDKEIKK